MCKNWNDAGSMDFETDPAVNDHNFCRNPGNQKEQVWCYIDEPIDESRAQNDYLVAGSNGGDGQGESWDYCVDPWKA